MKLISRVSLAVMVTALGVVSCKSDDTNTTSRTVTAAVVAGAQDSHCGTNVVTVNASVCHGGGSADAGEDAGAATSDYGDTMFNAEGDDDDCKYHVKWTATPGEGGSVTYTVTLTNKSGNTPVTGAPIDVEAFLDETHPAPNTTQTSKEGAPGTYTVGPVAFDVAGKWTVRFHVHDECDDSEESPHGHAAFFMQVDVK